MGKRILNFLGTIGAGFGFWLVFAFIWTLIAGDFVATSDGGAISVLLLPVGFIVSSYVFENYAARTLGVLGVVFVGFMIFQTHQYEKRDKCMREYVRAKYGPYTSLTENVDVYKDALLNSNCD